MGITVEFVAHHPGIDRKEMDKVALRSHDNAEKHQGNSLGLATLCGGGGVSKACALELV